MLILAIQFSKNYTKQTQWFEQLPACMIPGLTSNSVIC